MYDRATIFLNNVNDAKKKKKLALNLTLEEHGVRMEICLRKQRLIVMKGCNYRTY